MKKVALVVPCYNESGRWECDYWKRFVSLSETDLIFVNDGSTDKTYSVLELFCIETGSKLLHLPKNVGKGNAIRAGLMHLLQDSKNNYEFFGFVDADGAFSISDIEKFISDSKKILSNFDSVWTSRVALSGRNIQRKISRHFVGRFISTLLFFELKTPLPYDTQSGLKIFKRSESLNHCLRYPFKTRWFFEIELILRWKEYAKHPLKIWEWPVNDWTDIDGSKINFGESVRIVKELLTIWHYKFLDKSS